MYAIKVLAGGKILIGGGFTSYNGTPVGGIARLNPDGTLDTTFNPGGTGATGVVQGVNVQADGRIIISSGSMSRFARANNNMAKL